MCDCVQDAGRLVQLYISELRRALKSYQSTEVMHFGTLVSLTQVGGPDKHVWYHYYTRA